MNSDGSGLLGDLVIAGVGDIGVNIKEIKLHFKKGMDQTPGLLDDFVFERVNAGAEGVIKIITLCQAPPNQLSVSGSGIDPRRVRGSVLDDNILKSESNI